MSDESRARRAPQPSDHFLDDPVRVKTWGGRRVLLTDEGRNTERIVFFSDAVFAIALTLLVLDIRLPEGVGADLGAALVELRPRLIAFCISFFVIVGAWLTHFRRFRLLKGYDAGLIRWNFALLFLVCLVPFPTSVFAENPSPLATALYSACLGAIFAVQAVAQVHAWVAGLFVKAIDHRTHRREVINQGGVALVFLASIPLAFVAPQLPVIVWCLGAPAVGAISKAIDRRGLRSHR